MKVLKFFRLLLFLAAIAALFGPFFERGWSMGETMAAETIDGADQFKSQTNNENTDEFYLVLSSSTGLGFVLLHLIIRMMRGNRVARRLRKWTVPPTQTPQFIDFVVNKKLAPREWWWRRS